MSDKPISNEERDRMDEQYLESRLAEPPLESVPDADLLQPGSPVDPAAPDPDALHGTDLLNGAGADAKPERNILPPR